MVRPGKMVHRPINIAVKIACALGPKLPNRPVFAMFFIEEFDEFVQRISIDRLRISATRTRCGDDFLGYIAEVKAGLSMPREWNGNKLAQD